MAANGPSAILFFLFAVLFLNFYLANLVQAVVVLSYEVDEEDEDEAEIKELIAASHHRRFVFDPWRLRIIKLGPTVRSQSLASVRSVSERHLQQTNGELDISGSNVGTVVVPTRPVAVVRPQASPNITASHTPIEEAYEHKNGPVWPGHENAINYRVKSRPPSIIDEEDLPKIGFWDRNPACCFRCCCRLFPWLKFQNGLMVFVTDPFFDLFITFTIVVNTISMASRHDGMPEDVEAGLDQLDNVATYIFITEAVLKITAMCGEYFENRWNWLDFIVVVGSVLDIIMSNINIASIGFNTSIIRLLRLLRILKLAQSWKTMRTLLEIIFGTVGAIGNLMLVVSLISIMSSSAGTYLFYFNSF